MINNITLCRNCHIKIHNKDGGFSNANKNSNFINLKQYKTYKQKQRKERQRSNKIKTYLKKNLENRLNKEQQKELIEILNIRDSRNRLQKSVNILNQYLTKNYEMTVVSKRVKESGKLKTVWIISSLY